MLADYALLMSPPNIPGPVPVEKLGNKAGTLPSLGVCKILLLKFY